MFVLLFFGKYLAMDMIRPLLTAGVPWLRLIQVINVHESECSLFFARRVTEGLGACTIFLGATNNFLGQLLTLLCISQKLLKRCLLDWIGIRIHTSDELGTTL